MVGFPARPPPLATPKALRPRPSALPMQWAAMLGIPGGRMIQGGP